MVVGSICAHLFLAGGVIYLSLSGRGVEEIEK